MHIEKRRQNHFRAVAPPSTCLQTIRQKLTFEFKSRGTKCSPSQKQLLWVKQTRGSDCNMFYTHLEHISPIYGYFFRFYPSKKKYKNWPVTWPAEPTPLKFWGCSSFSLGYILDTKHFCPAPLLHSAPAQYWFYFFFRWVCYIYIYICNIRDVPVPSTGTGESKVVPVAGIYLRLKF